MIVVLARRGDAGVSDISNSRSGPEKTAWARPSRITGIAGKGRQLPVMPGGGSRKPRAREKLRGAGIYMCDVLTPCGRCL